MLCDNRKSLRFGKRKVFVVYHLRLLTGCAYCMEQLFTEQDIFCLVQLCNMRNKRSILSPPGQCAFCNNKFNFPIGSFEKSIYFFVQHFKIDMHNSTVIQHRCYQFFIDSMRLSFCFSDIQYCRSFVRIDNQTCIKRRIKFDFEGKR